jgi:putative ABC transport system permease protein
MLLESIWQDVRFSIRMMRSSLGLTTVAILSLALGVGTTTAIFSVMNALVLKPLPVLEPHRLVLVGRASGPQIHTYAFWRELRARQNAFSSVLAYDWVDTQFEVIDGQEKHRLSGVFVSGDYFHTLGVPSIVGRTLLLSDDRPGSAAVCVIGYDLWQRQYGGSRTVIGRMLFLRGHPFEIVGVLPRRFGGLEVGVKSEIFAPLEAETSFADQRPKLDDPHATLIRIVGRLKPGVSDSQASAALQVLGLAINRTLPADENQKNGPSTTQAGFVARAMPNGISYTRDVYRDVVLLLMLMAGVVLFVACTNLANLLVARGMRRHGEVATRLALGATRQRLLRQFLTESIVLSLAGTAVGLIFAHWGSQGLVSVISSSSETTSLDLSWDSRVITFTLMMPLLCALLFGLAPAVRAIRIPLYASMKTRSTTARRGDRFATASLIVAQVMLSMGLLVSAGLLVQTLRALLAKDPGYEAKGVAVVEADSAGYADSREHLAFVGEELLSQFRATPGVVSAARLGASPSRTMKPNVVTHLAGGGERRYRSFVLFISPRFFETRHTPLLAGRDFSPEDNTRSPAVAVLSQAAARVFFAGVNPIGMRYQQIDPESSKQDEPVEVIGIAKDINYQRPNDAPFAVVYRPISQCPDTCPVIGRYELRYTGSLAAVTKRIQSSAATVDSHLGLEMHLLTDESKEVIRQNRIAAIIATFFGFLTGILAMIGIYGVTWYAVVQRTHEIGVRMALGAQPRDVFRMIVGEAVMIVAVGVGLGVPAGFAAAQMIRGMLYGVTPADPAIFAFAGCVIFLVTAIAAFLPARHASKADPAIALRFE